MMKHISHIWGKFKKEIGLKVILLFLDYDGTLTQIVNLPDKAHLSVSARRTLRDLAGISGVELAIVSGRSLDDIKGLVRLKGIIYVGNHGLEIKAPGFKFVLPAASHIKAIVRKISSDLKRKLSGITGIIAENKGFTLSVHYRRATRADFMKMRAILRETVWPYLARKKMNISKGKKVFEIKPAVEWGKGHAVLWLLRKLGLRHRGKKILPIYIGDDVTDEDAFRALKNKGLTIFVGRSRKSQAQYYLRSYNEVQKLLVKIIEEYSGRINESKGTI